MSLFNHYTRGGQVAMHNLRMFKQVVFVTWWVAVISGIATFGILSWLKTTSYQWYLYGQKLSCTYLTCCNPTQAKTLFTYPNGGTAIITVGDLLHNRWFRFKVFKFEKILAENFTYALYGAVGSIFLAMIFFHLRGRRQKTKEVVKGGRVLKAKAFNKLLGSKKSDLKLAGCHLLKDAEMEHILIAGTTGVGKTNCLHELLPQIRARGNCAIIVDLRGNLVPTYYRPGKDIILNPFDARSENWHVWAECHEPYQFDTMAEILLPSDKYSSGDHEWWLKAGRAMFSVTAQKLKDQQNFSMERLKDLLITLPPSQILSFFANTDMASFASKESHKVTASVRNVLTPTMRKIACLGDSKDAFSIREWVKKDKGDEWLFLTAGPDQKETLQPLISAWMGWAAQSLKAMSEIKPARARMWFICDELPQLKYLPTLEDALAEIRGFGGCFVAGTQDYHQLQKLYGPDSTHTLLTLFNTKIIFRCPDKKTASYMAESLGEHETKERSEGISFGANDMRDGVTLNEQKKTQTIIRPSDLMKLPKLEAYLQVPGDYPPIQLQFKYQKTKVRELWYMPKAQIEITTNQNAERGGGLSAEESQTVNLSQLKF